MTRKAKAQGNANRATTANQSRPARRRAPQTLVVGGRELEDLVEDEALQEGGRDFLLLLKCTALFARLPASQPRRGAMPAITRFIMGVQVLESSIREARAHGELLRHANRIGVHSTGPFRSPSALQAILEVGEAVAFALDRISKGQAAPPLMRVPWEERLSLNSSRLRGRSDDAFAWFAQYLAPIQWDVIRADAKLELVRLLSNRNHPSGSAHDWIRTHRYRSLVYSPGGDLTPAAFKILNALINMPSDKYTTPFKLGSVAHSAACSIGQLKKFSPALQALGLVTRVGRGIDITSTGRVEATASAARSTPSSAE